MAVRDLLRSRLALRIYLVGLAQMAVVAAGFFTLLIATRPPRNPQQDQARFLAGVLSSRVLDDPIALERELGRARNDLRLFVTVIDPDGAVLATTARPGTPRCPEPGTFRPANDPEPPCRAEVLSFPDGRRGRLEYLNPLRPPPPFGAARVIPLVLVVVGVSSWLLARSLTRPLARLSASARAFGGGDLSARAALQQRDELGDVSHAFDEMAERVTDLLRAERELLANVSHELRTPLARIRVALDLASEGNADVARESIADIAGDLEELERLIADVLTAARLDLGDGALPAGIPPLRCQRIDVHDLLAHAASRFRAAHPQRALRVDLAEDLPSIEGDPVLVRRVIDNLLENAHKYTERPAARIELVARAGDDLVIEVIDQGIGVAPADLAQVFRPFFRADKSRTRATGGLGLGLALAKRIVDAHRGSIEILSALNEGTRARVRLPIAPALPPDDPSDGASVE